MKVVDFKRAFLKGYKSYDGEVGDWWVKQSRNSPHRRAYRKIAEVLRNTIRNPRFIVDYASANSQILKMLARSFPDCRFVLVDGSRRMLLHAKKELEKIGEHAEFVPAMHCARETGPRIRLVQTPLPNFSLPKRFADAVLFLLPSINATADEYAYMRKHAYTRADVMLARLLSRLSAQDPDEDCGEAEEVCKELLHARAISKNIHRLLRRNGLFLKADYAKGPRDTLSEISESRLRFGESSLDVRVGGKMNRDRFRYVSNCFSRSTVTLDVYQQTRNPQDKRGGYVISTFRSR